MKISFYKIALMSVLLLMTSTKTLAQSVTIPVTLPDSVVQMLMQQRIMEALLGKPVIPQASPETKVKAKPAPKTPAKGQTALPAAKAKNDTIHQSTVVEHNDTIRKRTVVEQIDTIHRVVVMEQRANPSGVSISSVPVAPVTEFIRGRHIERVNRDELNATFIPKKIWMFGGAVSYNEWDTQNNNLLILKNLDWKGHIFGVNPYFGYALANNLVIGGRFSYDRAYLNMGNLDVNLGEDLNINLDHLYYLEHTFEGGVFLRNYMPIGRSKVFGFFSEYRLNYGRTTGKNSTGTGVDLDASYDRINYLQLGFTPGISVFITNFAAAEVSVDAMGVKYRWGKQQTNRVEEGSTKSGSANFKINLFSIKFGMTFYL